jgi:leucyl-tRNA synthetase
MELVNALYHYREKGGRNKAVLGATIEQLIIMVAPFAPHIAEELWQNLGKADSVHQQAWPTYDEAALALDEVEVVLQVNGKVRGRITVPAVISQEEMQEIVLNMERAKQAVEGKTVLKVVSVPGKLVNIVVK